jgi:hypothetical protein
MEVHMKKLLFIAFLCVLLVELFACGGNSSEENIANTKDATITESTTTTMETEATTEMPSTTGTRTTTAIDPDEIAPYSDVLNEKYEYFQSISSDSDYLEEEYFALYDIDGDGTKEFMLGRESWSFGKSQYAIYAVYVIQNDVATLQQKDMRLWLSSDPPTVLFSNGTIRASEDHDEKRFLYFRLINGELIYQTMLVQGIDSEDGKYYLCYPNLPERFPLSKEEYERLKQEYEGDGQVVELDWKPLAEWGR